MIATARPPRREPPPHVALMLALARLRLQSDDIARANVALSRGVEWDRLLPLAAKHGVLPMLHRHLATRSWPNGPIPESVTIGLRRATEMIARRGLYLAGELVSLLRAFDKQDIRIVSLKGSILAQQLYGSPAMRRINDIDLLVAEEDLAQAAAVLEAKQYRAVTQGSAALDAIHRETIHHLTFATASGTHSVELHYCLHPPFGRQRYGIDAISHSLERATFFGATALVMEPARLLVYLCMHGGSHAWERLEWVCGVAELLRSGSVTDWDRVTGHARPVDGERKLRAGLLVAHDLLDAPVPRALLPTDASTRRAASAIVQRLTHDASNRPTALASLMYQLRTDPTLSTRATRLWSFVASRRVTDELAVPLPASMAVLYGAVRPVRLVVRQLGRLLGHDARPMQ